MSITFVKLSTTLVTAITSGTVQTLYTSPVDTTTHVHSIVVCNVGTTYDRFYLFITPLGYTAGDLANYSVLRNIYIPPNTSYTINNHYILPSQYSLKAYSGTLGKTLFTISGQQIT